jgi:Mlc titration factor MtfA (ptsG expression regulator)
LTDEIRVTIAAQACILLLHRDTDYYPSLTSVLVYPDSYVVDGPRHVGDGIWEDGPESLLGHTGRRLGALLLSWDDSRRGARDADDGANVVLHEFAHQLDFEDHVTDGTPLLESRRQYLAWARVLGAEFRRLRADVKAGREPLLDEYGATDEAEFFAVATEFFFERPVELRAKRPRLYEQLRTFFRQDPAEYPAAGKPGS